MANKHFSDGTEVDVFGWPTIGAVTLTVTGLSIPASIVVRFMVLGHVVFLSLPAVSGSSGSTAFQFATLPPEIRPTADRVYDLLLVTDKGKAIPGSVVVRTTGVLDLYAGAPGDPFATAGAKGFNGGEMHYLK